MNHRAPHSPDCTLRRLLSASALLVCLGAIATRLQAATQTQSVPLAVGWNAVWLEVEPHQADGRSLTVDQVFQSASLEIDIVARPTRAVGTAEFVNKPTETFNQSGWLVWYANPEAGGNEVFPVAGNQAYFVHVASPTAAPNGTSAGTLSIEGTVSYFAPTWSAGAYNLLGFPVLGGATFRDYLSGLGDSATPGVPAGGSPVVQRLDPASGAWVGVDLGESVQSGQAYWVWAPYSLRTPRYAGPVSLRFSGIDGIDLGPGPGTVQPSNAANAQGGPLVLSSTELTISNLDPDASHAVTVSRTDPATDDLQLFALEPSPGAHSWQVQQGAGGDPISTWTLGDLGARATRTVTVGGYRNWTSGSAERENLYQVQVKLPSGACYFWLPVAAERVDLGASTGLAAADPSGDYRGLWVGRVLVDSVTSLAEDGAPLRPTTSTLPLQLLIHFDGTNAPTLLSHVLFMQTKSADESLPNEPVLVVDETKIPYFEGIETRDGKRVGRRLETTAYDLPRKMDPDTQAALASANGLGTTAAITAFVNAQAARPPTLVEEYSLTWPLAGSLGPGQPLRTPSTAAGDSEDLPLTMDPFHRGNPFRHAFHPLHGAGYPVLRSLTLQFDTSSEDGLLLGAYREDLAGLTASGRPLSIQGTVRLQRVSSVATLQ